MFRVKVHKRIEQITEIFYRVGFWHRQDEETVAEWRLKMFYSIYYFLFLVSLIAGALQSDNMDEMIFLVEASIIAVVVQLKLVYLIWRKREILEQLNRVCEYDVEDQETFTQINNKLNSLMKFITAFFGLVYFCGICIALVVPFLGTERKLFVNIGFPLNYKNNEFAFWTAFAFIITESIISMISLLFSPMVWYLLANCGLRYVALGQQIKVMGDIKSVDETAIEIKITNAQRDNLYQLDLVEAITSHQHLEGLTQQMCSFLSNLFVVQLITSGLCICTSIYCLAFVSFNCFVFIVGFVSILVKFFFKNRGDNLIENIIFLTYLLYNTFDIFMVMYFGNEIQLSSDRLSYCLFESNWVDRSQSIKKNILIFGEFLMQLRQLVVLKLYPLNLETFMRILNSAYSMFNILQNFK